MTTKLEQVISRTSDACEREPGLEELAATATQAALTKLFRSTRALAPTPDIATGRTIGGRYLLQEVIGHGGMGVVFRAEHLALARPVAVKFLRAELFEFDELARFRDEALTASRLQHPNTVAVLDVGQTDEGTPYLVMEFVRGRTLTRLIGEDGLPSLRRTAIIVEQILAALDHAHRAGIVHADVQSDNVLVETRYDRDDVVKLVDFGLARLLLPEQVEVAAGDRLAGTPEYMAPEVIRGARPAATTDLYATGVILYELLTGVTPFEAGTPAAVCSMHLHDLVVPPSLRRPDRGIPTAVERVVARALEKDPAARFASAAEFAAALAEAASPFDPALLRRCAACGKLEPFTARFCPECGAAAIEAARTYSTNTPTQRTARGLK